MRFIHQLFLMASNPQYAREQLTTDKHSLVLLFVGLPVGIILMFALFWLIFLLLGEERTNALIIQVRPFVCQGYQAIFKEKLCSDY